eukprot:TRINITY_DN288_c0_g1_i5.p1 TRINITY_DN288_c0_g1~~TRINITY_DN288_c0_g1_i5.p1  ORF type:complete len:366 (-),score=106.45 TRINITY_DN288_c0_g1_i5:1042-2139(-)
MSSTEIAANPIVEETPSVDALVLLGQEPSQQEEEEQEHTLTIEEITVDENDDDDTPNQAEVTPRPDSQAKIEASPAPADAPADTSAEAETAQVETPSKPDYTPSPPENPMESPIISKIRALKSNEGSTHCFLTKESEHNFEELDLGEVTTHAGHDSRYYLTEKKKIKDTTDQGKELFEKLCEDGVEVEDSWAPSPPKPLRRLQGNESSQHTYITRETRWRKNPQTGELEKVEGVENYIVSHTKRVADNRQHGDRLFGYGVTHGAKLEEDVVLDEAHHRAVDLLHQPINPPRARPPLGAVNAVSAQLSAPYGIPPRMASGISQASYPYPGAPPMMYGAPAPMGPNGYPSPQMSFQSQNSLAMVPYH